MTVHIRIYATSDAEPAKVLEDLGSKFRYSSYDKVEYDIAQVDVERLDPLEETVTVTEQTTVDVQIDEADPNTDQDVEP